MYEVIFCEEKLSLYRNGTEVCTTDSSTPWKILEAVTNEKFENIIDDHDFEVSDEIRRAFNEAVLVYKNDFPDAYVPTMRMGSASKWCFFYSAIAQPSRVAALSKEKYGQHIKNLIWESVSKRSTEAATAWITLKVVECAKEGARLADIRQSWPGRFLPSDIPESFLVKHGTFLKPGKALKELCANPDDVNMEVFAGYFRDEMRKLEPECDRVMVSDKPGSIYVMGGRFNSCMIGKPRCFFDIYDAMQSCSIAYMLDEYDVPVARALLWKDVVDDKTGVVYPKVMDRIYFASNAELATMKAWAIRNGYIFKTKQSLGHFDFYDHDMNKISLKSTSVEAQEDFHEEDFDAVPYVDTFSWVKEGENKLYAYYPGGNSVNMTNTNGSGGFLTSGNFLGCTVCGDAVDEDYASYDNNGNCYCENCWNENFAYCEGCSEHYPTDDVIPVRNDQGCDVWLCDDCRRSEGADYEEWSDMWHLDMREAVLNDDTIYISWYRIESDTYHDWIRCDDCGRYFDAIREGYDGGTQCFCNECLRSRDEEDLIEAESNHVITCPACHGDMSTITMVWVRKDIKNSEIQYLCPDCAEVWEG